MHQVLKQDKAHFVCIAYEINCTFICTNMRNKNNKTGSTVKPEIAVQLLHVTEIVEVSIMESVYCDLV